MGSQADRRGEPCRARQRRVPRGRVRLEVVTQGEGKKITGTIPTTLTDFKIDPPSLLTLPVKNDIPVRVEMIWSPQ
jgi:hypothetical protein